MTIQGRVLRASGFDHQRLGQLEDQVPDVSQVEASFAGSAVRLDALLDAALPEDDAQFATVASDDGLYTASIPLETLRDDGLLIYDVDGKPLPRDSGGPFRLIVPDGKTLCWNVKAVATVTVTAEAQPDSVPANPPH